MKKTNKLYIVLVFLVTLVFCGLDFTIKSFCFGSKVITSDKVELYVGNIENNNPGQGFSINDNNRKWSETQNLNIFNRNQLFPGDSGVYEFLISNNTDEDSEYSMEFIEENVYSANIMYKLKRNDEYIAGDSNTWVYYDSLNTSLKTLDSKDKDLFKLEWEWVPTDNDTSVGRNKNATYSLQLKITATATELYFYSPSDDPTVDPEGSNVNTGDRIYLYVVIALLSGAILVLLGIRKKQKD